MRVSRQEIESFEYKEFVVKYIDKLCEYYGCEITYVADLIIEDSPKSFFQEALKIGIFNQNFVDRIEDTYGKLWISDKGFIDTNIINDELKKILKENGFDNTVAKKVIYHIFVEIIQKNTKYHSKLTKLYSKACQTYDSLEIYPIPKEYRDVRPYLKEYANSEESVSKTEELQELFDAAESILTDDLSLNLIKSIKEKVNEN